MNDHIRPRIAKNSVPGVLKRDIGHDERDLAVERGGADRLGVNLRVQIVDGDDAVELAGDLRRDRATDEARAAGDETGPAFTLASGILT